MEDFIDYILFLLLIFFIAFTGLLLFFLVKNPTAAYILIAVFFIGIIGIVGRISWKFVQKKRFGECYEDLKEITHAKKEMQKSAKRLEKPLKKVITAQFPKINQLCRETQRCVKKIAEIDKVILSFERNYQLDYRRHFSDETEDISDDKKLKESIRRYQENLKAIKFSKNQYTRQVQQVLRLLQELNSQILVMKYSQENSGLQTEIIESINDMLREIRSLNETA